MRRSRRSRQGARTRSTAGIALLMLVAVASLLRPEPAASQPAQADSAAAEFDVSFRILPAPLWSRSAGFAAGVGIKAENSLIPRDRILVTAKPGQHLGRYSATYFAGDPDLHPIYGLANAYYETTGRQWYYGTGPFSSVRNQIAVEKEMVEVELRGGIQPLGRRLFVQPSWSYHRHRGRDFANWDDGAYDRLDVASRVHLDASVGALSGASALQRGTSYGVAAGIDLRDRPLRTRLGLLVQASARRFRFQEPGGLEYDRYALGVYGYLPLRGNVLAIRALAERTEAGDGVVIPFYHLPSLDGRLLPGYALHRFFANDLFALTIEYAVPLFNFSDIAAVDALLSAGAGSVYDDLFEQFEASISFNDRLEEGADQYPLRPSVAAGFSLESSSRDWDVRLLLGWSAEGIRLVKFGFIHDLQGIELNKR